MLKYLLNFFLATAILMFQNAKAQTQVTVSQSAGYVNQVWHSLNEGDVASAPKQEWDIAFSVAMFSSSIHINGAKGDIVKIYPDGENTDWETVDATNFDAWPSLNNSAVSWDMGALDHGGTVSQFDYGWGIYNPSNHFVIGDSLYIIQTAEGELKKLKLLNLTVDGIYNFEIADVDGQNHHVLSLAKSDYAGKQFAYYSISQNTFLDREPLSSAWDLLFTQYTDYVPVAYTVAGILHHPEVGVLQVDGVDAATYDDWSDEFSADINTIGYDWKTFNGMAFDIALDRVYFVRDQTGNIWKIVFTGFGGSATGNHEFTKELISAAGVHGVGKSKLLSVFPNPAKDFMQVVTDNLNSSNATFSILDMFGRVVLTNNLTLIQGLQRHSINTQELSNGMYILSLNNGSEIQQVKFQISK